MSEFKVGDRVELRVHLYGSAGQMPVRGVIEELDVPPVHGVKVRFDNPQVGNGYCTASQRELTLIQRGRGEREDKT